MIHDEVLLMLQEISLYPSTYAGDDGYYYSKYILANAFLFAYEAHKNKIPIFYIAATEKKYITFHVIRKKCDIEIRACATFFILLKYKTPALKKNNIFRYKQIETVIQEIIKTA